MIPIIAPTKTWSGVCPKTSTSFSVTCTPVSPGVSSNLFNKYPESLILHIADMKATYILESPGMLEDFKAGLDTYLNKN